MTAVTKGVSTKTRYQRTLIKEVSYTGIGIHTGQCVHMRFLPAESGTGIAFRRTDLPDFPTIPATVRYVCDTARCTTIGIGDVHIHTIEHVMAALKAYKIDNLIVEVSNLEPPVANGGSDAFVKMIEEAGIKELEETIPIFSIPHPVYWSDGDIHLVALPYDGFKISYTLDYPNSPALKSQYRSITITPETFKNELSLCRTFSLYEEVSALMDMGLIRGGSLDNAVIIKGDVIFSKEGLHFQDEMVRHKILDMVGDLSLIGYDIDAHIIAVKAGHGSNFELAKKILQALKMEKPL
ncbi:MAG: UDP-3-O-acyl-N-acetylglucosamine deacetylase [Chlamydiota bacterium]